MDVRRDAAQDASRIEYTQNISGAGQRLGHSLKGTLNVTTILYTDSNVKPIERERLTLERHIFGLEMFRKPTENESDDGLEEISQIGVFPNEPDDADNAQLGQEIPRDEMGLILSQRNNDTRSCPLSNEAKAQLEVVKGSLSLKFIRFLATVNSYTGHRLPSTVAWRQVVSRHPGVRPDVKVPDGVTVHVAYGVALFREKFVHR